jgi:flagellar basal body rod protein FlgG
MVSSQKQIGLKEEYDILLNDLENINTYGYKAHFDQKSNKGQFEPVLMQGSLINTEIDTDIAIVGKGFLQVKLDDGGIAYTRNGRMSVNSKRQLLVMGKYYTGIVLPVNIYRLCIDEQGNVFNEKKDASKEVIGKIDLFDLDVNCILNYDNEVYISTNSNITRCLETSTVFASKTLYRMLYLLDIDKSGKIPNKDYKTYLIRTLIEKGIDREDKNKNDSDTIGETIADVCPFLASAYDTY